MIHTLSLGMTQGLVPVFVLICLVSVMADLYNYTDLKGDQLDPLDGDDLIRILYDLRDRKSNGIQP